MSVVQYPDEFMCVPLWEGGDKTWRWGRDGKRRERERGRGRQCAGELAMQSTLRTSHL